MATGKTSGYLDDLLSRRLEAGSFAHRTNGPSRPEATAWAVMAVDAYGNNDQIVRSVRQSLAYAQLPDGRIPLYSENPQTYWPTALAVLAWVGAVQFQKNSDRAVSFLLEHTGRHFPNPPGGVIGHDSSIKGWPWIDQTHSWIEPTSMSVLALRLTGNQTHARTDEAVRMIMDRQLPQGGWNYGNTRVLGATLVPSPEDTGYALTAVHGLVAQSEVENSLSYLSDYIAHGRSPLALTWGCFALGAWGRRPVELDNRIMAALTNQPSVMPYDTASLAGLLLALQAKKGLVHLLKNE